MTDRDDSRAPRALEVLATGPLALVQDRGRIGHLALGVGRAGAADAGAHDLGQRLLANRKSAASIEAVFGGLAVRARGDLLVALTGAPATATVDGRPVGHAAPFHLDDGQELTLTMPQTGLRTYLSVRGGIDAEPVLGSRSTDTMSGLGPAPLAVGDVLPIGEAKVRRHPKVDLAPVAHPATEAVTVRVTPGPRRDWFADPAALADLEGWAVSDRSDRKGIRLSGTALERREEQQEAELQSEGMVRGAIQVPPDGQPVVFLNDHPVTGGYPVIGVVRTADVDLLAQLVPGQRLRFRWDDRSSR